jgi:hypothetical protein
MSFRSPLTGSYRNSRQKDDERRAPRPSLRHGIAAVVPPAFSGSSSKACRAEFKKERGTFRQSCRSKSVATARTIPLAHICRVGPPGYPSFSPITYLLNYSAGEKSVGSEVIFVSDALKATDVRGFSVHHERGREKPKKRSSPIVRAKKAKGWSAKSK